MKLNILYIIVVLLSALVILFFFRKGRIPVKYTLVWLFAALIFLAIALFPQVLVFFKDLLEFEVASNMIFTIAIFVLLYINLAITIIISGQNEKIKLLIQEISILKKEIKDKKTK